jgi:nucleoid DNA-binding protein
MTLTESHQKTILKIVEIIKNTVKDDLVAIISFGSFSVPNHYSKPSQAEIEED